MLATVAHDFTVLLLAGKAEEAADKHWAQDIVVLKPSILGDDAVQQCTGFDSARSRLTKWLQHNKIEDISIDGPCITGNQFALFVDMQILNIASGKVKDFSEIATFTVRDDKIVEERFFYPPSERN
jgi:hypothetical protein